MRRKRKMKPPHLDKKSRGTRLWKSLKKGIADLIKNEDLAATEQRDFIVGYLYKVVSRGKKKRPTK